jgi:glutamyl-tRNA synthetase
MEDLDRANSTQSHGHQQLQDLADLRVKSDVAVIWQSDRFDLYREYLNRLTQADLTYECFCTRKEIAEAASAPHGRSLVYPGTCRTLSESNRRLMRRLRSPAIRLRAENLGPDSQEAIHDIVLWRNDGVPAYNLAVVVDDELQGITQVVRGDDLRFVTPSQNHLQHRLSFRVPEYVHLPLVVGPDGNRLAKRHGASTLSDLVALGFKASDVRVALLKSLEVGSHGWSASSSVSSWLRSLL